MTFPRERVCAYRRAGTPAVMSRRIRIPLVVAVALFALMGLMGASNCQKGEVTRHVDSAANNVDGAIVDDFNGDDVLDLVTLARDGAEDSVAVMLGQGDGSFDAPLTVLGPANGEILYNSVTAGSASEFDNDGQRDLLISHFIPGAYQVFLGQGDGTFTPRTPFQVPRDEAGFPAAASFGDIDRDGNMDIIALSGPTISRKNGVLNVYAGNGDGTFAAPVSYEPNPSALPGGILTSSKILGVEDVDGDDRPDLVLATASPTTKKVRVIFQQDDGSYDFSRDVSTAVPNSPVAELHDFDLDGRLDLLVVDGSKLDIQLGMDDGTFDPRFSFTPRGLASEPSLAAVADFNGDGDLDVALHTAGDDMLSFYLGKGNGTLRRSAAAEKTLLESEPLFFAGDFNGDDYADLIVHSTTDPQDNSISIYLTSRSIPAMP